MSEKMTSRQNITDWRHIEHGSPIPTVSYSDQPFVVKTDDGAWLCCVTTGAGHEGEPGQHVTTMRSTDHGKTWSTPVAVEPPGGPEASYAVMLKAPSGRIFIFYNHNTDNVREVKRHDGEAPFKRVDSLGHFVFKYSDDHGHSWSAERIDIPIRLFECDRENVYGGKLCFFWNVSKPFVHGNAAYVGLHKVGKMGHAFFDQSEGALLASDNLLFEPDPRRIRWKTLPDGEVGLRTPPGGGPIAEEQSFVVLSDGSFYVIYRSVDGYPVEAYSRDRGHTWSEPRYLCYADGRRIKNPRAANFVWKCTNGKYLYWFHNNGGHFVRGYWGKQAGTNGLVQGGGSPYDDRNPAWLCGGVEVDSPEGRLMKWSQPEIAIYADDPFVRMSYPDMIEESGRYFITETNKQVARTHEIPADFIKHIWAGLEKGLGMKPCETDLGRHEPILLVTQPGTAQAPQLPEFFTRDFTTPDHRGRPTRKGFALELSVLWKDPAERVLIDGRRGDGRGFCLSIIPEASQGRLVLTMNDGWGETRITSEPCIPVGDRTRIVVNVDGGPNLVSFIVNGRFCDGGEDRQFGWQRFSPLFRHVNWNPDWRVCPDTGMQFFGLKVFDRVLMTAEALWSDDAIRSV